MAWEEVDLEVVPIESLGFVPACVVNDEYAAFGVHSGDLFGLKIEVILEDVTIDSIKNHRAAFSG